MKLLSLPDELLSTIILEAMWATTTKPSNPPDLLAWERRMTNHPSLSLRRREVAFVGQICGRLRRIAQSHLKPPQLWADRSAQVSIHGHSGRLSRPKLPSSLQAPSISAVSCSEGQAVFLPSLPSAVTQELTELSVDASRLVDYWNDTFEHMADYKSLVSLDLERLYLSPAAHGKLLNAIASLRSTKFLKLLAVHAIGSQYSSPLPDRWQAPLTRLEVVWLGGSTLRWFASVMGAVAQTLQVAIFLHTPIATSMSTIAQHRAPFSHFPALWKLKILYHMIDVHVSIGRTASGSQQVKECSPIEIWRAAPRLEYFTCSERIVVGTQKELDEVAELRKRGGMKRLRFGLETWEGDKGAEWSRESMQELVVG